MGIPSGFLLLEGGIIGVGFAIAVSTVLIVRGRAFAGIGGLLLSIGATWLVLLGRVRLTCLSPGCVAPMIDQYLVVGLAVAGTGLVMSLIAAVRAPDA